MGATVELYNRFERFVAKTLTSERGSFAFPSLLPDVYTIRVSLASFVPAVRRNIAIQPGMQSFLTINLTSLLSSVELVYLAPGQRAIMSEDWKWVLRGAHSTRPVLRLLPGIDISDPTQQAGRSELFRDTHGVLKLSTGDAGVLASAGHQADLGTAFALATSLFGQHQLAVSGNVGYASHTGTPTAGFRTSFSRDAGGASPEVNLTMRQVFLPAQVGGALLVRQGASLPALQTVTVTFVDRRQLSDDLMLELGSSLESVSFLNRLNFLSPFARLRWGHDHSGALEIAYSSGAPATELLRSEEVNETELQHDLTTLSLFPRVSLRGGMAHVQRAQNLEVGYRRTVGRRTYSLSAYNEAISNATINTQVPVNQFAPGELLPDLASNLTVFNAGRLNRMGYTAALSQSLGAHLNAMVAYGYSGGWALAQDHLLVGDAAEVRSAFRRTWRHSLTARVSGAAPHLGTRYIASYQFTDYSSLSPVHLALTQRANLEPGLNFYLRQPIPGGGGMLPGRLEATAEVRNALAQGYLSLPTPGGQRIVLVQAPRSIRGGLSLIF
jgi:hypothetical protein